MLTEPIPTVIKDTVTLDDDKELQVTQFNFPNPTPTALVHEITFVARHGFYVRFVTQTLSQCRSAGTAALTALFSDIYNADSRTELCDGYSETPVRLESFFHTFKLRYEVFNGSVSSVLGRVTALPGRPRFPFPV